MDARGEPVAEKTNETLEDRRGYPRIASRRGETLAAVSRIAGTNRIVATTPERSADERPDDVRSTTACALTPLMPNALHPANVSSERETRVVAGRGCLGATRPPPPADAATTCALRCRRCAMGGEMPRSIARTATRRECVPAAPSACPDALLGAARRSGRDANAATNAATSMGSPSGVAVPCAATETNASSVSARSPPRSFASAQIASRTSACCDAPFGAVSDADRPSWFVVDAAIATATEKEGHVAASPSPSCPSPASLASNGSMKNATHPSPRPYPFALASRVLHLPSGESAPSLAMDAVVSARSARLTPAATAASCVPPADTSDSRAMCVATRDDEHAVSIAAHAPLKSSVNATRPAMKLRPEPVLAAAPNASETPAFVSRCSDHSPPHMHPTYTDVNEPSTRVSTRASTVAAAAWRTTSLCEGSIAASSATPAPTISESHANASTARYDAWRVTMDAISFESAHSRSFATRSPPIASRSHRSLGVAVWVSTARTRSSDEPPNANPPGSAADRPERRAAAEEEAENEDG